MSQRQVEQQHGKVRGRARKLIVRVLITSQIAGMLFLLSGTLEMKFVSIAVIVSYVGYIFGLFAREFKPSSESASKSLAEAPPAYMRRTIVLLTVGLLCSALAFLVVILFPMIMAYIFPHDPGLAGLPVVLFLFVTASLLSLLGLVFSIMVGFRVTSSRYPDGVARVSRIAPFVSVGLSVAPLLIFLL